MAAFAVFSSPLDTKWRWKWKKQTQGTFWIPCPWRSYLDALICSKVSPSGNCVRRKCNRSFEWDVQNQPEGEATRSRKLLENGFHVTFPGGEIWCSQGEVTHQIAYFWLTGHFLLNTLFTLSSFLMSQIGHSIYFIILYSIYPSACYFLDSSSLPENHFIFFLRLFFLKFVLWKSFTVCW